MFKIDRLSRRMFLVNAGLGPGGTGSSGGQANDGGAGAGGMNDAGANDARAGRDNYGGGQKGWGSGVVSQGATHSGDSWNALGGGMNYSAQQATNEAKEASKIVDRGPTMVQKGIGKGVDTLIGFFGGPIAAVANGLGLKGFTGSTVGGHATNALLNNEISNVLNPGSQTGNYSGGPSGNDSGGNDYTNATPGILNTGQPNTPPPGPPPPQNPPPTGGVETPQPTLYGNNRIQSVTRRNRYV